MSVSSHYYPEQGVITDVGKSQTLIAKNIDAITGVQLVDGTTGNDEWSITQKPDDSLVVKRCVNDVPVQDCLVISNTDGITSVVGLDLGETGVVKAKGSIGTISQYLKSDGLNGVVWSAIPPSVDVNIVEEVGSGIKVNEPSGGSVVLEANVVGSGGCLVSKSLTTTQKTIYAPEKLTAGNGSGVSLATPSGGTQAVSLNLTAGTNMILTPSGANSSIAIGTNATSSRSAIGSGIAVSTAVAGVQSIAIDLTVSGGAVKTPSGSTTAMNIYAPPQIATPEGCGIALAPAVGATQNIYASLTAGNGIAIANGVGDTTKIITNTIPELTTANGCGLLKGAVVGNQAPLSLNLLAGSNVVITPSAVNTSQTISVPMNTLSSLNGSGISVSAPSGGVQNIGTALVAGSGIGLTPSAVDKTITISGNPAYSTANGSGISIGSVVGGVAPISANLVAGDGISIVNNGLNTSKNIAVSLTAGAGIAVSGSTISANLTAGAGIAVSGGTVSCTLQTLEPNDFPANPYALSTANQFLGNNLCVPFTNGGNYSISLDNNLVGTVAGNFIMIVNCGGIASTTDTPITMYPSNTVFDTIAVFDLQPHMYMFFGTNNGGWKKLY